MVGVVAVATRGVLVVDAAVLCAIAAVVASRREAPGTGSFAAAALALAGATLSIAVFGQVGGPGSLSWGTVVAFLLLFVSCWLLFVASYTGEWRFRSLGPVEVLVALPAIGVVTVAYLSVAGSPIQRVPTTRGVGYAVLFALPMLVVGALFLGSAFSLVRAGIRYASADVRRSTAVAAAAVAGGLLPLLFVGLVPPADVDAAPGFAATGLVASVGFGLAVVRYDLFESVPVTEAIARERLVSEIDDLVVIVDRDGAVVDLNEAAEAALGVAIEDVVGDSAAALLAAEEPVTGVDTVEIAAEDGRRIYEASASTVTDDAGRTVGHGLVLRDVTDRQTRRQRLTVLNRVLRHNLRNDMTTVMGYADLIEAERADPGDLVERIHETADALTELGDKAREIEQIMAASDERDVATDAARLVQYVAAEARKQYPAATVDLDLSGDVTVAAPEQVLWPILWNLVENACEHAETDEATIRIGARPEDGRVVIDVVDDGPGIPENERRAINAGEEEPLSHGSGLGLWAVKWGANRVGGDVEIADAEPSGARVTIRLPAAPATAVPAEEVHEEI